MDYLDGAWAEMLGWSIVLAGLLALTGTVLQLERRSRRRRRGSAGMTARLERTREWELVMRRATKELSRGPQVEALQADATVTIEAAEYAYNRVLMDCARHAAVPGAPPAPLSGPAPENAADAPAATPAEEQAPLAA